MICRRQVPGERPALRMGNVKAVYQVDPPPSPPSPPPPPQKRRPLFAALLPCCYVPPVHETITGRGGAMAQQAEVVNAEVIQEAPAANTSTVQPEGVGYAVAHHMQVLLVSSATTCVKRGEGDVARVVAQPKLLRVTQRGRKRVVTRIVVLDDSTVVQRMDNTRPQRTRRMVLRMRRR